MNTRLPRSSFHHAVVTFFGSLRSTSRANASAQRRTSGNVQLGSIRHALLQCATTLGEEAALRELRKVRPARAS